MARLLFAVLFSLILNKAIEAKTTSSQPTIITAAATDSSIVSSDNQFIFGVATAAYQIEGAYNIDGRGPSVWDEFSHRNPSPIVDQSTGDEAADSYHNLERDLRLLEELGVQSYRFSISWSRILPHGESTIINPSGLEYYSNLIDQLTARKIIPFVTMFHWDSPLELQEKIGGWTNRMMNDYFVDYARILFDKFGDRVKHWITFNEPNEFCGNGYGSKKVAPGVDLPGLGDYACMHNVLISHARVYQMYQKEFLKSQGGEIGITLNNRFVYQGDGEEDLVKRYLQFTLGWKMDALFDRPFHGYPAEMVDQIEVNSRAEGRMRSRLPKFTEEEKEELFSGKIVDFLGLNYYTSRVLSSGTFSPTDPASYDKDLNLTMSADPNWSRAKSDWLYLVPQGLSDLLDFIKQRYNNPKIYITENGWSDDGQLKDDARQVYLKSHLREIQKAKDKGSDVQGYFHWSLIDNFEWERGYTEKFGLYQINFTDPRRTAQAKKSAGLYRDIIANGIDHLI